MLGRGARRPTPAQGVLVHLPAAAARLPARAARHPPCARVRDRAGELLSVADVELLSRERHMIQWYPGHIARAERQLQEQLAKVDIVFDVRDARILHSTVHPRMDEWTKGKRRFIIVNRTDMVGRPELRVWQKHFAAQGRQVFLVNGRVGTGVDKLAKAADQLSEQINASRLRRGLKPRSVRACVVGYPNIGKSALINRLLKRKVVKSEARAGVTRSLRWVRMGDKLDLLDSPGIIPGSMKDQAVAEKLAICDDIGEASYDKSAVAAALLRVIGELPEAQRWQARLQQRYRMSIEGRSEEDSVAHLADLLFQGDIEQAGSRILQDYRTLRLGSFALEHPVNV